MVEDRDIETRDVEHVELVFLDEFWYGSINHSVKMGLQQFTSTEN